jgi:CRP-like cAMP-binding protein
MPGTEQRSVRNRLLAALPPEDFARLAPALERVELPLNASLFRPGEPIEAAHFVEAGTASMLAAIDEGASLIEVGMVGRDGVVGLPLVLGGGTSPFEARVQTAGAALRARAPPRSARRWRGARP